MIISHKNKFIFIKTKKVAGTSLEVALSKLCGDQDVITPNGFKSDSFSPQNYKKPPLELSIKDWGKLLIEGAWPKKYYNHISAKEIARTVPKSIWGEYFKFTVVRNPYDRMVSSYFWRTRNNNNNVTFSEFLREEPQIVAENWRLYTIKRGVWVDDFVRYENLEEDLARLSRRIGLRENVYDIMKGFSEKKGIRPKNASYRNVVSEPDRLLISELAKDEISLFGYEF